MTYINFLEAVCVFLLLLVALQAYTVLLLIRGRSLPMPQWLNPAGVPDELSQDHVRAGRGRH